VSSHQSNHVALRSHLSMIWSWLAFRRKLQIGLLLVLASVGALAEMATLGALLPFLATLDNPAGVLRYPIVVSILGFLDWTDGKSLIAPITVLFGFVVVTAASIRLVLAWATIRFVQGIGSDLAMRVYSRTLQQPYIYHVSRNTNEIVAGVLKADAVAIGILAPIMDVFVAVIMSSAIIGGLIAIDWVVALSAAGLFGTIYLVLSHLSASRVVRDSRVISANTSARILRMQEGLGGIRDILLDGSAPHHLRRFQENDAALRWALVRNSLWGQMPRYFVEALGIGIIAGLAVVTSVRSGSLSQALPVLGVLALGAQKLFPLFQRIYGGWNSITGNQGNLEDVVRLANAPSPAVGEANHDRSRLQFLDAFQLRDVGFRYRDDTPWVFRQVHLRIRKGARIGFVGETGCGKSTLLDVCMGLLTPTEGHLEIDGVPLTPDNVQRWQARIAHVPQSIFLADTTLAANIAFGQPPEDIEMARVQAAAERARIHDFVLGLPDGYETPVGERGVRLSGGQRQRVGIARALYREADVLVLDEATSALDGETENSVMEGIDGLGSDVTVLIVAHRLSTLEGCDEIYEMGTTQDRRDAGKDLVAVTPDASSRLVMTKGNG
jgi:ABC-type multidrug transport system fused ATPase/permease subunit